MEQATGIDRRWIMPTYESRPVSKWLETLAKAEKSHAGRFQKALDTLDD
jgi:rubrerythrin